MLSLELFISGELESGDEPSVLRAIGLLQSLLVRKHSNMKVKLPHNADQLVLQVL